MQPKPERARPRTSRTASSTSGPDPAPPPEEEGAVIGTIVGRYVATAAGVPMESRDSVSVVAGRGIEGDRYFDRTGHWSDPRWPDQELTMIETETAEDVGVDAASLRRNVVTRGVALNAVVGSVLRIG